MSSTDPSVILCYGDSLTWGFDPRDGSRYPFARRWPGAMQASLGPDVRVIEEALPGRTASIDHWLLPARHGAATLPMLLESHAPMDAVILMLGANDTAPTFRRTAGEIAFGCASMIWTIQRSGAGRGGAAPAILLLSPPPVGVLRSTMKLFFEGGEATSHALAAALREVADRNGAAFLDAGSIVRASEVDGVHLEQDAQVALGRAIADTVRNLLDRRAAPGPDLADR